MSSELILIRHGVTAWNKERRFQGHVDIPLDAQGEQQALALGKFMRSQAKPDALFASDLSRTIATAKPMAEAFAMPLQLAPEWRERHYGSFEGLDHAELTAQYPQEFDRWRARELDFPLPGGGESVRDFHARIVGALQIMSLRFEAGAKRIVVVTHGGVLGCVYRIAMGLAANDLIKVPMENTGVNRLWFDPAGGEAPWQVRAWGELTHLV